MKKLGTAILTILFGGALFVGSSFAAENARSGAMGQQTGMQTQQTSQAGDIHQASKLVGKSVKNQQGEELGELSELLVDNQGQVKYIILQKDQTLGMGGDLTPIPWQAANPEMQEDSLVVNIEKQKLDGAPTVEENELSQMTEQQLQEQVRGYFGEGQTPGAGQQGQQRQGSQY